MPTDGRPGGAGFTSVTTAPDTAVFPFVNPDAPVGEKDQDITVANLKAVLGAVPAGPVTATLTGDGTSAEFDVVHSAGSAAVSVRVFTRSVTGLGAGVELLEGDHFVADPKVGAEATTVTVRIDRAGDSTGDQPLANGDTVAVFVSAAAGIVQIVPTIETAAAALALDGSESVPIIKIAAVTGDLTVTVDAVGKQTVTCHLVGDGTARTVTWAGDPLVWADGVAVTTVPASGRLVVQFADHGDGIVLAVAEEFS